MWECVRRGGGGGKKGQKNKGEGTEKEKVGWMEGNGGISLGKGKVVL